MPRRESSASAGLVAVTGTYGDVVVGSKIQGNKGTLNDVWEVVEVRNPDQIDPHMTLWFRAVNVATGEEVKIPPRVKTRPVTFMVPEWSQDLHCPDCKGQRPVMLDKPEDYEDALCQRCEGTGLDPKPKLDPRTQPARTEPSDSAEVELLVRELGAVEIAVKDHETGEIHCPPYEEMVGVDDEIQHHLEFAHGIDMSMSTWITPGLRSAGLATIHGEAHSPFKPKVGKDGFPHRHVYKTQATEAT